MKINKTILALCFIAGASTTATAQSAVDENFAICNGDGGSRNESAEVISTGSGQTFFVCKHFKTKEVFASRGCNGTVNMIRAYSSGWKIENGKGVCNFIIGRSFEACSWFCGHI